MSSSYMCGKKQIGKYISENNPKRILDLGCGSGIYAKIITTPCEKIAIDAVDREQTHHITEFYNEFYCKDIRDTEFIKSLGHFDFIIMGDVLEHLTYEDARKVLDEIEPLCNQLIVAVPYEYEQKGLRNPYQKHWQPDLTPEIFAKRYPEFELLLFFQFKKTGKPKYGYYILKK